MIRKWMTTCLLVGLMAVSAGLGWGAGYRAAPMGFIGCRGDGLELSNILFDTQRVVFADGKPWMVEVPNLECAATIEEADERNREPGAAVSVGRTALVGH